MATYRLQLHAGFTFRDATAMVPYLAALGISDCYASPYLKAAPGSTHGYDITDHSSLNPEIGTHEDHAAWLKAMSEHGLGLVLDVVPNHMGILGNENPWWNDVLENGQASLYAPFFDIDWSAPARPENRGRVLAAAPGRSLRRSARAGRAPSRAGRRGLPRPISRASLPARSPQLSGHPRAGPRTHHQRARPRPRGRPGVPEHPDGHPQPARTHRDEPAAHGRAAPREGSDQAAARHPGRRSARDRRGDLLIPGPASTEHPEIHEASTRSTCCSRPSPIDWPTGGSPGTRSTTAASSTSTRWPRCGRTARRSSAPPMP